MGEGEGQRFFKENENLANYSIKNNYFDML